MPAPPRSEAVQRDTEEVGRRVVDPIDLVPPLPELQERVLRELFRVVPVPGHEVEGFEQPFAFLLEEDVEAGPCFDLSRGETPRLLPLLAPPMDS